MNDPTDRRVTTAAPAPAPNDTLTVAAGVLGGLVVFILVLNWLPPLAASLTGPEPRAYWYLSRAAGITAYGLIWLSVVLGLSLSNRLARIWPGGPTAADLHQFTGFLALGFAAAHGVVLLGDRYIGFTLAQILVPFTGAGYRPFWVGLGQIGFYLAVLVAFSVYLRGAIGYRTWRLLHYGSFGVYLLATFHALGAGTDSTAALALPLYLAGAAAVCLLTVRRILMGDAVPSQPGTARGPGSGRPARAHGQ
jgi:predicted ferric reductase